MQFSKVNPILAALILVSGRIVKVMMIIIKIIIWIFFFFIFFSLASALYFLVHDKGESDRIVKALTWRIGLSLVLFILLIIAFAMGWIHPHSIIR